jgi:hypothetical protein
VLRSRDLENAVSKDFKSSLLKRVKIIFDGEEFQ